MYYCPYCGRNITKVNEVSEAIIHYPVDLETMEYEEVEIDNTIIVDYRCPKCDTILGIDLDHLNLAKR